MKTLPKYAAVRLLASVAVVASGTALATVTGSAAWAQGLPDIASPDSLAGVVSQPKIIAHEAKTGPMARIGTRLAGLAAAQEAAAARNGLRRTEPAVQPLDPLVRMVGDRVVIDAVASDDAAQLLRDLEALGLVKGTVFGHVVSGQMPVSALRDMAALKSLQFARPSMAMTNIGSVTSQGDASLNADVAREEEEVSGRRVTVGVMSDTYDCLGGAAADIASGDLPPARRITILSDIAGPGCTGSDEGRGMMQLVRDVAPGASQAFHTAFNGQADFANGILRLANEAGADIVVDDVIYFAEPMFQDGIIAQAADTVTAQGVAYFSSAGNGGRNSWESGDRGFVGSGSFGLFGGERHDFDPDPGAVEDLQSVMIANGTTLFALQWDQPFASVSGPPGSASDVDIILYGPGGAFIGFIGGFDFNIGGDAVEVFGVVNSGPPVALEIGIELFSGPAPGFMKFVIFDPSGDEIDAPATSFVIDFPTFSSTNYGHSNADGAAGVGAAFWRHTPRFGVSPPVPEVFSSAGGTPILFDTAGMRIATETRLKPNFTGPDGGITTFFGNRDSFGTRTPGGNHFFGTSASAPHVAAVAALMLEANRSLEPADIVAILEDTAIDMDDPFTPEFDRGFDFGTGHGYVDALAAVEEAEDFEGDDNGDRIAAANLVLAGPSNAKALGAGARRVCRVPAPFSRLTGGGPRWSGRRPGHFA